MRRAGLTTRRENGFWPRRADLAREICSRIFSSRALNRSGILRAATGQKAAIVAESGHCGGKWTKLSCAYMWVLGGMLIYGSCVVNKKLHPEQPVGWFPVYIALVTNTSSAGCATIFLQSAPTSPPPVHALHNWALPTNSCTLSLRDERPSRCLASTFSSSVTKPTVIPPRSSDLPHRWRTDNSEHWRRIVSMCKPEGDTPIALA